MKHAIESISEYIPPKNVGYSFMKRTNVFIPYKEIGISILERTVTPLSFVYETVLKYLSIGVSDIEKMATLLGLEMDIYKEVISEMALADLIVVSEMSLILTIKGRNALQELTKVTIKKSQLNELYVNMVTGNIENHSTRRFYERPTPGFAYLDQDIELDIQFLRDRFDVLEQMYDKDNEEELLLSRKIKEKSLYRILDIAYQNIKYLSVSCFVYLNEEDSSLLLIFVSTNESTSNYSITANAQILKNVISMNLLFETNRNFIVQQKTKVYEIDLAKNRTLNDLISVLQKRVKIMVPLEEFESLYYTDRYLLDGELTDILNECQQHKPKELIIASSRIRPLLQDNAITNTLIGILSNTKITLIYNNDEYGVDKSQQYLLSQLRYHKSRNNIRFCPLTTDKSIDNTQIVCSPGFVINSLYELVQDNMSRYLLREISDISFDTLKVQKKLESLRALIKSTC